MRRGFSLLELAIGLVVLGIITGIGIGMVKWLVKTYHINQNRSKLSADASALISSVAQNNGNFSGDCRSFLPYPKDEWDRDIICVSAEELKEYNVCALRKTSLKVKEEGGNETENVAFVLISGGENLNVQTGIDNSTNGTVVRIYPYGKPGIDDYPDDFLRKEPYDDAVKFVKLEDLKEKVGCPYSHEKLHIATLSLPASGEGETYNASVYAVGGVTDDGSYNWCYNGTLASAGIKVYCGNSTDEVSQCPSKKRCKYIRFYGSKPKAGTYRVSVSVWDKQGNYDERSYSIVITPAGGGGAFNGIPPNECSNYTLVVRDPFPDGAWVDVCINGERKKDLTWDNWAVSGLSPDDEVEIGDWLDRCKPGTIYVKGKLSDLDLDRDCVADIQCIRIRYSNGTRSIECDYF